MLVPVQKKRVFEDISAQIINQIEDGNWKEGEQIKGELELSKLFQVSRGSIREAIKSLQIMGILVAVSGQGTFVAENALQKIKDSRFVDMISDGKYRDEVLECRYMIEPQAAFVAAKICTEQDIAYLQDCYDTMMAYADADDVKNVNCWGQRFHTYIIEMMKNKVLSAIYKSIEQRLLDERKEFMLGNEKQELLMYHHEHLEIIDAFRKHDAVLARKIMDQHLGRQMHWKRFSLE
ncbi:MAG: FadR family transcriptional regulator [Anaerotignum sp.]|jgi:GntR family transcriptional repressor for pyruvate dehydrogenase complex|nr:FadR family transcriptional regulator [Anaerotignum sp.]